jgi:hypothetical protein
MRIPFPPTTLPTSVVLDYSHCKMSDGLLICISFMARDVEDFFMWFLAIWISSLKKSGFDRSTGSLALYFLCFPATMNTKSLYSNDVTYN